MEDTSEEEKTSLNFIEPRVNPIDNIFKGVNITKRQQLLFHFVNGLLEPAGISFPEVLTFEDKQFIEKDRFKIGRLDALQTIHPEIEEGIIVLTFTRPPFPLEEGGVTLTLPHKAPILFSLKDFKEAEKFIFSGSGKIPLS